MSINKIGSYYEIENLIIDKNSSRLINKSKNCNPLKPFYNLTVIKPAIGNFS
jgi:hypothetical protein